VRGLVVLPLLIASAAAVFAAPNAAEAASGCVRVGEHIVSRGTKVVVVSGRDAGEGQSYGRLTVGCRLSDGRRFRLGETGELITRKSIRVDGLFVAYEEETFGDTDGGAWVYVQHLRGRGTRRQTFSIASEGGGQLTYDLVVRADGSSAYIGVGPNNFQGVYLCRRWGCDPSSRGTLEKVDDIAGVRRHSLMNTPTGVSWIKDGHRRSASLAR
jgi:hypothetical protein